ncbi:MAG: hypothetical protein AAF149_04650 [Bacteroidota bacterium]
MQKILILSYFFPPSNLTASQRIEGWAKNLSKFGYYPIVITRNWDVQGPLEKDRLKPSGSKIEIVENDGCEVHYLPYKPSLRDYCLNKDLTFFSKIFTFLELVLRNFFIGIIPFHNLHSYAQKILESDKGIRHLLISANPYEQFYFGYKLKKRFKYLKWIADYRDEWTTRESYGTSRGKNGIVKFLEKRSEFKWLQNSDLVITTCNYFAKRIASHLDRTVNVIEHGVSVQSLSPANTCAIDKEMFIIVYGGTLYSNQPVERFLKVWSVFKSGKSDVEFILLGSKMDVSIEDRFQSVDMTSVSITERLSKERSDIIQKKSAMLLLLPYIGMKGWPSSKLYHYLAYKRPILFYPNDHDIMEKVLLDTETGIIPKDDSDLLSALEAQYLFWKKGELAAVEPKNISRYTQRSRAEILAKNINKLN